MPFTATQIQADIINALAPVDPAGLVSSDIVFYWSLYASKAAIAPVLQEKYTFRRCLDLLLAYYAAQVDVSIGQDVEVKQAQISAQLRALRTSTEEEIRLLETRAAEFRPLLVGALTSVAPISQPLALPAALPPDANDPRYSGFAYQTIAWPRG